jgi:hypothetical protein
MSFYQARPMQFFSIFIILMTVDVFWFFAIYHFLPNKKEFEHQKAWTINNVVAIIVLLVIYSFSVSISKEILTYAFATTLFLNTIADYKVNWEFYFPVYVDVKEKEEESR